MCLPLRAALIWTKSKAVVVRIAIFSILNEANLLVLKLTFSSFLVLSMLHTHARTHARTHDNVNDTHIMEMMIISGVSCQLDLYLCLYPYFIWSKYWWKWVWSNSRCVLSVGFFPSCSPPLYLPLPTIMSVIIYVWYMYDICMIYVWWWWWWWWWLLR